MSYSTSGIARAEHTSWAYTAINIKVLRRLDTMDLVTYTRRVRSRLSQVLANPGSEIGVLFLYDDNAYGPLNE